MGCIQQLEMQEVMEKKDETAQTNSKAAIYSKNVMLYVLWDFKGIVFVELLPDKSTIIKRTN